MSKITCVKCAKKVDSAFLGHTRVSTKKRVDKLIECFIKEEEDGSREGS